MAPVVDDNAPVASSSTTPTLPGTGSLAPIAGNGCLLRDWELTLAVSIVSTSMAMRVSNAFPDLAFPQLLAKYFR